MTLTYDILPLAIGTYNTWTLGAGATKPFAVNVNDGDTGYIAKANPATGRQSFTMGQRPDMFTVSAVQAVCVGRSANNYDADQALEVHARLGTTDGAAVTFTGLGTALGAYTEGVGTLPRPGGGTWSVNDLLDSSLEIVANMVTWEVGTADYFITYLAIRPSFIPAPSRTKDVRLRASRYIFMNRKSPGEFSILTTPDKGCDMELLDPFTLTHRQWPAADGAGATTAPWTRPLLIKTREELIPMLDRVLVSGYDARYFLTSFYESGHTQKSASIFADGVMRIDGGNTRTFLRDSKAWVQDPGGGEVREIGHDIERYESRGLTLENESTNGLTRSSFVSQLTGWATTTDVTAEPAADNEPLFENAVTAYVAKIASNAGAIRGPTSPASTSYSANTHISVSLDYREGEADSGLTFRIRRNVDSWNWNGTDWQAAAFDLPLTNSTVKARAMFADIDVGTNATTITVRPVLPAVASKTAYIYHAQVEALPWVTGRIVTDAATVTRETESLKISNNAGQRAMFGERGTVYFKFFPDYSASAMNTAGGFPNFFTLQYDANNSWECFYNGVAGSRVDLEAHVGGVAYAAHAPYSPVAYDETGTWVTVRYTGSEGEWGLAPYTLSVFVGGVKGTDVTMPALPTEAATSDLYIGGNDVDWAANGAMRYIWFTPRVHSDDEVKRLTAA